jgi:hypothetical protein
MDLWKMINKLKIEKVTQSRKHGTPGKKTRDRFVSICFYDLVSNSNHAALNNDDLEDSTHLRYYLWI